jgi:membrane-associated phospholipid phosphatase
MSVERDGPRHRAMAARTWLTVALLLALFAIMAAHLQAGQGFRFDDPILRWLHARQTPARTTAGRALVRIGDPTSIAAATILVLAILLRLRRLRMALRFTFQVGGAGMLDATAKALFARPWPTLYPALLPRSGHAFPSGHAVGGVAFFLALQLLLWRNFRGPLRWGGTAGLALAFAIGVAVCYTQVHFPSDVLAGWALGAAWTLGAQLLIRPRAQR